MGTGTWTQEQMNRALCLYVELATAQFRARYDIKVEQHGRQPTKTNARFAQTALEALRGAQEDARVIFFDVIEGRIPVSGLDAHNPEPTVPETDESSPNAQRKRSRLRETSSG